MHGVKLCWHASASGAELLNSILGENAYLSNLKGLADIACHITDLQGLALNPEEQAPMQNRARRGAAKEGEDQSRRSRDVIHRCCSAACD